MVRVCACMRACVRVHACVWGGGGRVFVCIHTQYIDALCIVSVYACVYGCIQTYMICCLCMHITHIIYMCMYVHVHPLFAFSCILIT